MTSRFSLRITSRRRLSAGSGVSSASQASISQPTTAKPYVMSAEEEKVENEIRDKVRLVLLDSGVGNEFGLHWREILLNQKSESRSKSQISKSSSNGATSPESGIDDSYETDVSDNDGNVVSYSLESSSDAALGDSSSPRLSMRKSSARRLDPDGEAVPMLSGWVSALNRQVNLPGQTGLRMAEGVRKVLVLDDDNQLLHICNSEQLKKAKSIPYSSIEECRFHNSNGKIFFAIHVASRSKLLKGSKVYYFKSVRDAMPYKPQYGQDKVIQWICAIRYRCGLYDSKLWDAADQVKYAALWVQSVYRMNKGKLNRKKVEAMLREENRLSRRVSSLLRGESQLDKKARVIDTVLSSDSTSKQSANNDPAVSREQDDTYSAMITSKISSTAQGLVDGIRQVGTFGGAMFTDMIGTILPIKEEPEQET